MDPFGVHLSSPTDLTSPPPFLFTSPFRPEDFAHSFVSNRNGSDQGSDNDINAIGINLASSPSPSHQPATQQSRMSQTDKLMAVLGFLNSVHWTAGEFITSFLTDELPRRPLSRRVDQVAQVLARNNILVLLQI